MLISKDEAFNKSSVYVASLILKHFKASKGNKLSIFEIAQKLKKYDITQYGQMFSGLLLLYSTGIVDFKEPFIILTHD